MSGGITMSKALLNTKPRYPRNGLSQKACGYIAAAETRALGMMCSRKVLPQLVNIEDDAAPISLIGKPIELVKEYLKNQDERMKLERDFDAGMDITEWYKLSTPIQNEHDELSSKMIKEGIFESKHDYRSFWKFVGKDEDDITLADLQKQLEEN